MKSPLRVVITGAAGQIGYSLIPLICGGTVFGEDQPIELHLLDLPMAEKSLRGVVMEIEDCAYPLVKKVVPTSELKVAFDGVHVAVLVGGMPRKAGMQRADLMEKNAPIFVDQGAALEKYANRNVKVLVVANPANTNCLITALNAPSIPKKNFTCLTRLDENRAKGQLALKLGTTVDTVGNAIIWGNHSKTQYPDLEFAHVLQQPPTPLSAKSAVADEKWVDETFVSTVQNRGAAVIEARGFSSAMSAANASADHLRSWFRGTQPGDWVSMGVWSEGQYGIAKDIIYSFPCDCVNGEWKVVENLQHGEKAAPLAQKMMRATEKELVEEKAEAVGIMEKVLASRSA
jgi:malate dehydrogenase